MARFKFVAALICLALAATSCSSDARSVSQPDETPSAPPANHPGPSTPANQQPNADHPRAVAAPTAEDVLKRMAEFYQAANSIQATVEHEMQLQGPGMDTHMTSTSKFAAEKPNRFAIRSDNGATAIDVVTDGKTMFTYIPAMNSYSESEAPQSFDELIANPVGMLMGGGMGGSFLVSLLISDPYKSIMEGVTSTEYLGTTTLADASVHHVKATQDQFDWEAWIATGETPLLHRISIDMSKAAKQFAGGGAETKMTTNVNFRDWRIDATLAPESFVFVAPQDAKKSDDLFGSFGGGAEETSPLLGEAAPDVKLKLLDESEFNLADHAGEKVVMLDFWATWCGPCVEELPLLAEVAKEFAEKGVHFCAINQGEQADTIREFLEEKQLEITVALDAEGAVGNLYGVQGIPMLVLVDKQGIVQSVHVGYSPNIKSTLRRELNDILEGKNLAGEAKSKHQEQLAQQAEAFQAGGLELAWSQTGSYAGVVADSRGNIYAAARGNQCDRFDRAGEKQGHFDVPGSGDLLRLARLTSGDRASLVVFGTWGQSITAFTDEGTLLWQQEGGQGIDDVWPADLDGDGLDEVIVGYNGGTGLHVFDHDGKKRWEYDKIGNVWHVCAGDVNGDSQMEVVSTSAEGAVHIFSSQGEVQGKWETPIYANMIRVGRVRESDSADTVFVIGSGNAGESLVALDRTGSPSWTVNFPAAHTHCDSAAVCAVPPWMAVGLRGGLVSVIDCATGDVIASINDQGQLPVVTWAAAPDSAAPILLVATGRQLNAFTVAADTRSAGQSDDH